MRKKKVKKKKSKKRSLGLSTKDSLEFAKSAVMIGVGTQVLKNI